MMMINTRVQNSWSHKMGSDNNSIEEHKIFWEKYNFCLSHFEHFSLFFLPNVRLQLVRWLWSKFCLQEGKILTNFCLIIHRAQVERENGHKAYKFHKKRGKCHQKSLAWKNLSFFIDFLTSPVGLPKVSVP